ncbi:protein DEK isoform X2 [Brienomyrus brachyistius]|uniref:protein DEK isoform X2 n=1 Tax=Brienomyrus brachyistius TaxID=42636 RepID=UPI0020B1B8F1|nr:protein DEK isoform X2 [Brienomyrus brachyistius]
MSGELAEEAGGLQGAADNLEEDSGGKEQSPRGQELQQMAEIIERKREKKSVQRLDLQIGKPAEPLKIEEGRGMKLGYIEHVAYYIGRTKADELKPLHKILFNRPGAVASLKKNIRQFSGFLFEASSDPYNKKRDVIKRLTLAGLKNICTILDLETSGTHDIVVDRILTFLLNPKTRERPLPKKRKRASSSKSKAIIIDSSSDDEVSHGDKGWASAPKSREMIDDDDDSSSNENDEVKVVLDGDHIGDEDNATEKMDPTRKTTAKQKAPGAKKTLAKKLSAVKKRPASRKTPGVKKKMESIKAVTLKQKSKAKITKAAEEEKSATSDLSDNDSEQDETPKSAKKRPVPTMAKPAAKTKKADSSSSSSKMTGSKSKGSDMDDSSDNEPLIKLLKKPPTDEQLRETINRLLKDANLEEVTMKHMYKKVFETYPESDLTGRKAFIKQTVKKFIS